MSSNSLLAAAAVLSLLAAAPAQAETVSRTLDGTSLAVDVNCVDKVEIQPEPGLVGKVTAEASSSDPSDLTDFVFTGGDTASVTRERKLCVSMRTDRPKVTVAIRLPPGMAIDIRNAGSTDYVVGPVAGNLHARLAGSGDLSAESVTEFLLDIAGSSGVRVGRIAGPGEIRLAGSGDVKIAEAVMPSLKIDVRGSGDVAIEAGEIGTLAAAIAGSGDLRLKAVVKDATLSSVGSGTIEVAQVTGSLSTSKAGSGSVRIGKTK